MSAPWWIRRPLSAPTAKVRSSAPEMSTYASLWTCRRRTPMLSAYADLSHAYTRSVARTTKTEAVVLRSIRFGEADRVLHLYTLDRGRVGAVAKGVRKTMSRFGARLEPLSHVELVLHRGRSDLQTVTAAQLVRSHREAREDYHRFSVGMIGAEAMLRLFSEEEANERAFTALTRFLDLLDEAPHAADRPSLDPLGLAFQLKLLWVAGYLPHVTACAECGAKEPLVGYSTRAGGAVCARCAPAAEALALAPD